MFKNPLGPLSQARSAGKLALWGIVALGFIIILGTVTYRVFFQGRAMKEEIATGVVAEEQAQGTVRAGQKAQEQLVIRYETHRTIENRVETGVKNVYSAEDDAAAERAARDALCMSDSYRRANDCTGLHSAPAP